MTDVPAPQQHILCDPPFSYHCVICRNGYHKHFKKFTICHKCGALRDAITRPGIWNCEESIRKPDSTLDYCRHEIGKCLVQNGGCKAVSIVQVKKNEVYRISRTQEDKQEKRKGEENGSPNGERYEEASKRGCAIQ